MNMDNTDELKPGTKVYYKYSDEKIEGIVLIDKRNRCRANEVICKFINSEGDIAVDIFKKSEVVIIK